MDHHEREMTRRILWKLDVHVLPPLILLWLANFIDRSNIGNARIAGLETDTHLKGNQFNITLALFFASYILIQIPSNWVLKRMGANRLLPLIVVAWGVVTTLTGIVHNFGGLATIRVFLGFCEGGLLPGIILYLSTLYKRHELQLRVGLFYATASLSGAFGGLLATAIAKMNGVGGLSGWRWIFILEGMGTVVLGIGAMFFMPAKSLATAKFFTEEEREFVLKRFQADHSATTATNVMKALASPNSFIEKGQETRMEQAIEDSNSNAQAIHAIAQEEEAFEWGEVVRGVLDPQTWITGIAFFGLIVSVYSYSLFLPTIVVGLGYSGSQAQLRTVPPYVSAAVLTIIVAFLADRLKWRGPFVLIFLPLAIAGYILIIVAETNSARYAAVFLMAAGVYPSGPCLLSVLPNNSSGHYKKATTTGLQFAIANFGGIVATFVYTQDQSPRYIKGHSIALGFLVLSWLLILINVLYCSLENKARAEGRRQQNLVRYQELWDSGKTRAPIGDRHPDFRYTL